MLSLVVIFTEERSIFDCLHNLALAASNPLNVKQQPTTMNVVMGSNLGTSNDDNMPPLIHGTTTPAAPSHLLDTLDMDVNNELPMPGPLPVLEMPAFDDIVGVTGKLSPRSVSHSPRSVTLSTHRNVTLSTHRNVRLNEAKHSSESRRISSALDSLFFSLLTLQAIWTKILTQPHPN